MMPKNCAYIFLVILSITSVLAQSDVDDEADVASQQVPPQYQVFVHPLTNMPGPASDVETYSYFPKYSESKFPIGDAVTVLCHFTNQGMYPYNITAIMGSLNSPFDFNFHIQNYSYKPVGILARPGDEITLDYQFQLHPDLQPVSYYLAHTVFYEDETSSYSTTFFNETIELFYPNNDFDVNATGQLALAIFYTLIVAIALAYSCMPESLTSVAKSVRKSSSRENEDWLNDNKSD